MTLKRKGHWQEIKYDEKGRKLSEVWLEAGRFEGPQNIYTGDRKAYLGNDLPSVRRWDPQTGELIFEAYYEVDQNLGRDEELGPALIKRDPMTGVIVHEQWRMYGGELHRSGDLPAFIVRHRETGLITREDYWVNGHRYREPGKPAIVIRNKDTGEITKARYFIREEHLHEYGSYIVQQGKPKTPSP